MFFNSLKKEILIFTLGVTIVTIIATTMLGVSSTQTAGRVAEKATSDTLREQAKKSLMQIVESTAQRQDLLFQRVTDDANNIASYMKNIYENQSIFSNGTYWKFNTHVFQKNGRYLNSQSDISTIHLPSFVRLDGEEKNQIELQSYLDFIVPNMLTSNPNTVAVYTIDEQGVTRYFPNILLGNIASPDYDPREAIFYKQTTPQENPDKKVLWSALYIDEAGRGLMVTASTPIYTKNGFKGVIGIDVLLNNIIKNITAYTPIEGSYAFLIDKDGNTIAFPDKAYQDILGRPRKEGETQTSLASSSQTFLPILKDMMHGAEGFGSILSGGKELFVAYTPLKQTGFSMAIVASETVMLKAASSLREQISNSVQYTIANRILPTSLLIILFASIISVLLVTRIIKPIHELTLGAYEIGKGNLDYKLKIDSKNEIGDLASSFRNMSKNLKQSRKELKEYSQGLEVLVEKRTKELTVANTRLKELDQLKSEFLSFASHQLRSPLTAIKGYASLVLEETYGKINKRIKQPVDRILQSSTALAMMVDDFLNISRIEQGGMKYDFQMADFKKLVEDIIVEQQPNIRNKKLELSLSAQPEANYNIKIDAGKIKQVVTNLIDNSIKYTPKGSIKLTLKLIDRKIQLEIKDTGIGFNKETLSKLFAKFSRDKNANKINIQGSGLGLYLAKEIMEAHHGHIWAQSPGEGKGSSFFVEFYTDLIIGS